MNKDKKLIWTSLLTALGASLCCITPILALISGASGMASTFSWMEPFRPYLIGLTIFILTYAWYQKLKPQAQISCDCDEDKESFMQSKKFLLIITVFALLSLAFPYYSNVFYPNNDTDDQIVIDNQVIDNITFKIEGMTCTSCADHINHVILDQKGITDAKTSYENGNAIISYDKTQINSSQIKEAINSTGYKVIK